MPSIRIYILDEPMRVEHDGCEPIELSARDGILVFTLVLAGSEGMLAKQLGDVLGADVASGALRKRCQRTRKATGLPIDPQDRENQTYWVLDISDAWVDTAEYLRLAEQLDGEDPEPGAPGHARELRTTLGHLWHTEPPAGLSLPESAQHNLDYLLRAHARVQQHGRRVLIIDDKIAEPLTKLIRRRHLCEAANTFEEFDQWTPQLESFALVVVDRNLSGGYHDKQGEWIVNEINESGYNVAVAMMSVAAVEEEVSGWINQLLLVAFIPKTSDDPNDQANVAAKIFDLLESESDLQHLTCDRIVARIRQLGRRTHKRLTRAFHGRQRDDQCKELQADMDRIHTSTNRGDAAQARRQLASFVKRWGA